ncbi:bifunctional purple acid phosphatase 26-like [Gossypium australe]|uniref:Bifunctional purple acid phosphatase 26-like n=1 Tax=Gossypium australe TaxID=47621 RepID=A0A5B6VVP1_9ROSI|nr:bifunctional purple acid phosphatase 26-like [Gossypium australe]
MVQAVEAPDSARNKVFFSVFGFLDREVSLKVSNLKYKVQLSSGERYPVPKKSTPVYITIGDGGNQEGLAGRSPTREYSAFREASYGHSTLEIQNGTHAFYH